VKILFKNTDLSILHQQKKLLDAILVLDQDGQWSIWHSNQTKSNNGTFSEQLQYNAIT